ncbi:MAG TPA: CHAT domain-containing protein [Terriglobales bacterium]|jgi:CHAT domain-containing protein|nr:CHAT domain-containing protein [Terriglobales bacterium]
MRITRVTFGVMIFGILCAIAVAQESESTHEPDPLLNQAAASANDEAETSLQRALHFADLYNWHASRPHFTRAQQLFEAAGDKRNALYAHFGAIRAGGDPAPITEIAYRLGQELATNPILESDKELRMFCLIVKGDFDGEIDVPAMRRDWTEVAALAREMADTKWQYRAQGQLGFADFYDGDLASAQRNVGAALIAAINAGDVGAQIFYLSATANGLLSQQMNDQAIIFAERAITVAEANPDAGYPMVAQHLKLLAMLQAGRMEGARTELNSLLVRAKGQNDRYQIADIYTTASLISQKQKDIPGAITYLNEALRYSEAGYGNPTPEIQSDLSDLYRLSGNLPKAEELARNAAESAQSAGYIPRIPLALHALAQVQIIQHKYTEADGTYDRAAMIQDMMIGNADSTLGKTALVKGGSDLYAKHFALVAEHLGDTEKAFAIIEQVRGRVMTDLLVAGVNISPESLEAEKKIARLRLKLMAVHSDREIRELRDEIFLAEQFRSITPEISILKSNVHRAIALKEVQASLSPSEAILEYVMDEPASYCVVITRENAHIAKLPGKQVISSLVSAYLSEVKAKHSAQDQARRLYDVLLDSISESRSKEQLVIIRDGQLHLIPFDALLDHDHHYLVESRTVVYSPSAASFFLMRTAAQPKDSERTVLAVGGVPYDRSNLTQSAVTRGYSSTALSNLPGSRDEALAAAAAFPSRSRTLLLGDSATESAFKQESRHRVIHLAVHAIANETQPERAALVLLSDPAHDEDGFLQASEIVQLPLNADLVVLSACDTAVGPLEGQEGISTLSRAFLLAGARTVVSTLWSVEDETTLYLMKSFYGELNRKNRVPGALAAAKRKMLKTFDAKAVPYYWAGFTVEGVAETPIKH